MRVLGRVLSIILPVAILLAIAVPNILSGNDRGRGYSDQVNYHQRVVETFSRQWPAPDLSDYPGVMTPLYHLLQAFVHRHITDDWRLLQFFGSIWGPITLLVVWVGIWTASGLRIGSLRHAALLLPLTCSMYVWDSTAWLLPDNMAWAIVAAILALCFGPVRDPGRYRSIAAAGALLLVLIATRQSNIWLAAPIWVWAALRNDPDGQTLAGAFADPAPRIKRGLIAVIATLPAFILLGWFFVTWGGRLQPPMWDEWYARKWNPSAGPFVLSLVGLFSVFFAGVLLPTAIDLLRRRPLVVLASMLITLAIGVSAPSTYDMSQGRYGAIWSLADKFPSISGRALLIVGLAALAGPALVCWATALDFRRRWVFVTALAAFAATQYKNPWLYQRYADPLLLILFALAAASLAGPLARVAAERRRVHAVGCPLADFCENLARPAAIAGPVILAILLGLMGVQTMRSATTPTILPPGSIGHPPTVRR